MPINIQCPYCLKVMSAREELAGKKVDCPNCMTQLDIPNEIWSPNGRSSAAEASNPKEDVSYYMDVCPHCNKIVSAPNELLWQSGSCPSCKKALRGDITAEASAAQPEAAKPHGKKAQSKTASSKTGKQPGSSEPSTTPIGFVIGVF